jgi:phage replication O-like protein O
VANPSIKNGFIPVAIELVEQFYSVNIPGEEWRIIWALWRKTWGWKKGNRKKDWDWISISQFEKMTKMKKANVHRSLKSLLAKRLIVRKGNLLKFNQNYNEWVLAKRLTVLAKRLTGVSQKDIPPLVKRITTKDIITKDTLTINNIKQPSAVTTALNKVYNEGKGLNIYALLGRIRKERHWPSDFKLPDEVLLAVCNQYLENKEKILNEWPWFLKVLHQECTEYFKRQEIERSREGKKADLAPNVKEILAGMLKI